MVPIIWVNHNIVPKMGPQLKIVIYIIRFGSSS